MTSSGLTVLLVGKGARNSPVLQNYLEKRGCNLSFATSQEEALELFHLRRFDVVLSEFMLADGPAYPLIRPLLGTNTTMFFSNAVEDGCWWMTAVFDGQDLSADPGMRPAEFTCRLDQILSDKLSRNKNQPLSKPTRGVPSHVEF